MQTIHYSTVYLSFHRTTEINSHSNLRPKVKQTPRLVKRGRFIFRRLNTFREGHEGFEGFHLGRLTDLHQGEYNTAGHNGEILTTVVYIEGVVNAFWETRRIPPLSLSVPVCVRDYVDFSQVLVPRITFWYTTVAKWEIYVGFHAGEKNFGEKFYDEVSKITVR